MPTRVRSRSKINLGLAIGPSRPDGFHGLTTVYQTLAAHDLVTVEARTAAKNSITLTTTDRRVPTNSRNTAWKMAESALAALGVAAAEVHIHIDKRLPVQGGLGAGSANAVAALIGLECELGLRLSGPKRLRIAADVGSDVPLFLIGGAVLGVGRGEEVYPLPDLPAVHCVVALPAVGVSTPQAFRDWDVLHTLPSGPAPGLSLGKELTRKPPSARLKELSQAFAASFCEPHSSGVFAMGEGLAGDPLSALVRTGIENDFEEVVFPQHPSLGEIKRILVGNSGDQAIHAALSGSGSAVFGLYQTEAAAIAAEVRLKEHGTASLRTMTLPRDSYWSMMMDVYV